MECELLLLWWLTLVLWLVVDDVAKWCCNILKLGSWETRFKSNLGGGNKSFEDLNEEAQEVLIVVAVKVGDNEGEDDEEVQEGRFCCCWCCWCEVG